MIDYEFFDGPDFNHAQAWSIHFAELIGKPWLMSLEVGCNEGKSAVWLLDHVLTDPTSRLVCVDCWDDSVNDGRNDAALAEQRFRANIERSGRSDSVLVLKGYSQNVLPNLHERFDTCYIDASHDARSTLTDSVLAWPLVKPGGIVIWDDYLWSVDPRPTERPQLAIDSFLAVYDGQYEPLSRGWQIAVRKL